MGIKQTFELQKGRTENGSFKQRNLHHCAHLVSDTLRHLPKQADFEGL